MFSLGSLPLWGPGFCLIPWPVPLRRPYGGPLGPPSILPNKGWRALLTRGALATSLESIPEASQGPRKEVQLLVHCPLGGWLRPVSRQETSDPKSQAGDSRWSLNFTRPPLLAKCFRCKSLKCICREPLSSGRGRTFFLTACRGRARGQGVGVALCTNGEWAQHLLPAGHWSIEPL